MRIVINGEVYKRWIEAVVDLTFDRVASTFSITSIFDKEDEQQQRLLKPLAYNRVEIYIDEDKILTGTILNHQSTSEAEPGQITMTGYSVCGVLADCEIPEESYPLQDTGKTLQDIARKLITPFGVELHVNQIALEESLKVIDKTTAEERDNPADYITKLASQFNLIVGNTRNGRLLFTKLRTSEPPQSNYVAGSGKYEKAKLKVDGRRLHSRYTVKRQSTISINPTSENPEVQITNTVINSFRPQLKIQSSGNSDSTENAARAARAAELGNIQFDLDVEGHRYNNGKVMKPNRVITLKDDNIFLFRETRLFVRGVTLKSNAIVDSSKLNCVPLEALTGEPINQNIFTK